jgi:uncharacterized protein YidB (DUF937 family)
MNMLDKLISGALQGAMGGGQGGAGNPLMQILGSLLSNQGGSGGIGALIQQFQQAGLGDQMQSWVGTGKNMPISIEQLTQVFGAERMQQMAGQAGVDPGQFGGQLSEMLPQMIDKLTPSGQVPQGGFDGGGLDDVLGQFGKLLGR